MESNQHRRPRKHQTTNTNHRILHRSHGNNNGHIPSIHKTHLKTKKEEEGGKKRLMTTQYDWEKIKKEYVYGIETEDGKKIYPTFQDLCDKYGFALSTIGSRAKNKHENWRKERKKVSEKIEKKVMEKKTELEAIDIVESDQKFESTGEALRKLIERKIKINHTLLDKGERVRDYDLKNLGDALKSAQDVVKTAQGEAATITKNDHRVEGLDKSILNPDLMQAEIDYALKLIEAKESR